MQRTAHSITSSARPSKLRGNVTPSALAVLPGYKCVYPDGELPGLWVLYPNRRVLHRTRLLIDFLTTNLRGAR